MKKLALTILALGLTLPLASNVQPAIGQTAVLFDLYGRGVHAYYAGDAQKAYDQFSMAINNGIEDPRAFYFRGISACALGRPYEAETDWQQGARLEARGKMVGAIGRALARFQGSDRLKLEAIRQKAKLEFLAEAAMRSKARYGEIESTEGDMLRGRPNPPSVTRPPVPPSAVEDPFADDLGDPSLDADDALEGALKPPPAEGAAPAAADNTTPAPPTEGGAAPSSDPFGGGGDADPFGGGGGDPFGGGGADPFGGGGDPFGGDSDPFGN
jgi:hypothetical protein